MHTKHEQCMQNKYNAYQTRTMYAQQVQRTQNTYNAYGTRTMYAEHVQSTEETYNAYQTRTMDTDHVQCVPNKYNLCRTGTMHTKHVQCIPNTYNVCRTSTMHSEHVQCTQSLVAGMECIHLESLEFKNSSQRISPIDFHVNEFLDASERVKLSVQSVVVPERREVQKAVETNNIAIHILVDRLASGLYYVYH